MIINPDAPDEYKYETDYRKIPREYLNPNIPEGRRNVKWSPFATIPEQFEILNKIIQSQNEIKKPSLSEDALSHLDYIVQQKLQTDELCSLDYWEDGHIQNYTGNILKFDQLSNSFTFCDDNDQTYQLLKENICNIT
ncbi:YolD-like family protein [Staphylococcus caledonicus]|uniref:YolD-like family protein n=1 Tax=Staphylococcus caledonicus TaxID=2741333 RepID=UPI003C2E9731